MRTLFGAPMIDRDRAELQIAAVLGAALGVVTGYAIGKPLFGILIWGSLVQSLSAGWFIVCGLFVSECPLVVSPALVGRGRKQQSRRGGRHHDGFALSPYVPRIPARHRAGVEPGPTRKACCAKDEARGGLRPTWRSCRSYCARRER